MTDPRPARSSRRTLARVLSSPSAVIGWVIVLFWVACAIAAPTLLGEHAGRFDTTRSLEGPSSEHLLGTDSLGRDLLARVLVATQITFLLSFGAVLIGTVLGIAVGVLAAVLGNTARQVLYQLTAAATAFPAIILAILLATLVGRSGQAAMLGLAIASVPSVARLVLNLTSSVASMDYVSSARMLGVRRFRLMWRHIVPNIAEPIVTLTVVTMGSNLMMLAAMSFLGIGVQLPDYDWGGMISEALRDVYRTPWTTLAPAAAIVTAGIGFSLAGERLAELLDPRGLVPTPWRTLRGTRAKTRATPPPAARASAQDAASLPDDTIVGIRDLSVWSDSGDARVQLLHGIDLAVRRGERLGIVGESGSGKSLAVSALAHMLPGSLAATSAEHRFDGTELRELKPAALRRTIASGMPMVFQDPMSSLNPALTIGAQMGDRLRAHTRLRGAALRQELVRALHRVGIPEPERRLRQHPHELSGGQRQRVSIAMATLAEPKVILADEPTTALDVSVQAQVVDLLRAINEEQGVALVLVSHDLALVSQVCERIVVLYGGRIVEEGPTAAVIADPQHPYTRALLGAVPDLSLGPQQRLVSITDYSWDSDEYRSTHPTPRHGVSATGAQR